MTSLETERKIAAAWRRRYGFQVASSYERRAIQSYRKSRARIAGLNEINRIFRSAKVVAFGDDRGTPEDQREILKFLTSGSILSRIRWVVTDRYEDPNHFLLRWFRKKGVNVRILKRPSSLNRADAALAREIKRKMLRPGLGIVWTGALRLAPAALPSLLSDEGMRITFISLEAPELRWKMKRTEGWSAYAPFCYAWLARSPLLALEHRRASQYGSEVELSPEDLADRLWSAAKQIAGRMKTSLPPPPRLLIHPFEMETLQRLNRIPSKRIRAFLLQRLLRGESACLPREKIILLSTLDAGHLAEEAAHYVRLANSGPGGVHLDVVEEAFAFMASRWVDPKRAVPVGRARKPTRWDEIHRRGYRLGDRLFRRWNRSAGDRQALRKFWNVQPKDVREAMVLQWALELPT